MVRDQIVVVKGIRVTTVAQTFFDVVRQVPLWTHERALDDALLIGKVTIEQLEERLRFYEGSRRPGLPLLRALFAERREDGWVPPESELEAIGTKIFARFAGRARFERQVTLRWRSGAEARVDFVDARLRIIIEVDGRRWHTRVADFDRDLWRTNEAIAHGYVVLRFTWVHLTEAVDDVVALVEAAIAERSGIRSTG